MKKAMSVSMVFVLIFTIIVISLIVLFGYKIIGNIFCLGGDSQVMKSFNDVEKRVNDIYRKSKGSSEVLDINIPSGEKMCFVNDENPDTNIEGDWFPDPDLKSIIKTKNYNVWLDMCGEDKGRIIKHLVVKNSFCITSPSRVYIENMGNYVSIEKMG